ncbi:TonB-dependent receptor [Sphingosinicella sp. YJ22]|uniref:TonB-dependent receptor plug domain-containing protein n=1 Tax=Sphingosinicella sp. YJ22 TaxID=1104780 RepID=UPI0014084EB5|nr:TonB-dependent receptor [Sphingosinicella sp. YJ22]
MISALLIASLQVPDAAATPVADEEVVVTASLVPVAEDDAPASVTLFDAARIEALGSAQASDLIRLAPGASVSVSGGQGALTQVRLRGAEANHTLVFIDGIAFNDLAAGNQARFETFSADGLGRMELVRGPQSALWGSEALGGVIAMESPDPLGTRRGTASVELGSSDFLRASGAFATGGEHAGLSSTLSFARGEGIDILGGGTGDRDGFETLTAALRGAVRFGDFNAGAVGRYVRHETEYDASDPFTFQRADTADVSEVDTKAGRIWLGYGDAVTPWQVQIEGQHLDSENRNRLADTPTNASYGRRTRLGAQAVRRFEVSTTRHTIVVAAEHEEEAFGTRDLQFGGASDRDLERGRTAFVGEWRAEWGDLLTTDVAVRHDDFSAFRDATTLRLHAELDLGGGVALVGGYGEGIAQPSFVDLFGFGPGSGFIGNSDLRPERSEGFEGGLRWRRPAFSLEAIAFSNDLREEIVEDFSIFPNYTVVNAPGESRRRGIELSGEWRPSEGLRVSANYTYTDTREPETAGAALREVRRPEHTANLAGDWRIGPLTLGGSLAYVGERTDRDFDLFPAPVVKLGAYVLASARFAYRISEVLEAYARVENGFDEQYQDVVGYATPGRSVYAGIRLSFGD